MRFIKTFEVIARTELIARFDHFDRIGQSHFFEIMPEPKLRARNDDAFGFEKQSVNPDEHADQKKRGQNRNDISRDDLPFGETVRLVRVKKRIADNADGDKDLKQEARRRPKKVCRAKSSRVAG